MAERKSKEEIIIDEVASYVNDDVSYIDALVHYAQKNDMEIELVGDIVRRSVILKARVAEDAENLKLIEKRPKLPL